MSIYTIGTILKEIRIEKGISQTDMCQGLCSKPMVSYIENEMRIPHRKLIESLFSRLGETLDLSKVPMTKADLQRANLEFRINACVAIENNEIKDMLDEYVSCKKSMTHLEKQFVECYETFYINRKFDSHAIILPKLVGALKLTIKDYSLEKFPSQKLLSRMEIIILNNIARCFFSLGKQKEALEILTKLKEYYESDLVSEEEKAVMYPLLLFNITNYERMLGKTDNMRRFSKAGLNLCLNFNKLLMMPYFLFYTEYASLIEDGTYSNDKIQLAKKIIEKFNRDDDVEFIQNLIDNYKISKEKDK